VEQIHDEELQKHPYEHTDAQNKAEMRSFPRASIFFTSVAVLPNNVHRIIHFALPESK
jgi:hypothetical protein